MKRLLILLLISALFTFAACGEKPRSRNDETAATTAIQKHENDCDNIENELASEIKLSYIELFYYYPILPEQVWIDGYFGSYSGYEIVDIAYMYKATNGMPQNVKIGGYTVTLDDGDELYAYKDGMLYKLEDAYDGGMITDLDLYEIASRVGIDFKKRYPEPLVAKHIKDSENVEREIASEIKRAYVGTVYRGIMTADEIAVDVYLGYYGKCHIVQIFDDTPITQSWRKITVGPYIITLRDGRTIYAYSEGEFCTLAEAYDKGWLNDAHVYEIGTKVQITGGFENIYILPKNPLDCDNIPPETASRVKNAYKRFCAEELRVDRQLSSMWIEEYLGSYSGHAAVYMGDGINYYDEPRKVEVAGYKIFFPNAKPMYICAEGNMYTLEEAYDNGFITKSDVYQLGLLIWDNFRYRYPTPPEDSSAVSSTQAEHY